MCTFKKKNLSKKNVSPHYKLFETQTQFIVVTKELRVCWDFIQKDLRHLQWALQQRGGGERRDKKQRYRVRQPKKSKNTARKGRRASFRHDFLTECLMLPRAEILRHNIRTISDHGNSLLYG